MGKRTPQSMSEQERRTTVGTLFRAAQRRIEDARLLAEAQRFVAAHYIAGVAVEAMLDAYWVRDMGSIPRKHDVDPLEPKFLYFVPPAQAEEAAESLRVIKSRWDNSHRYRDDPSLRIWLRDHAGMGGPPKRALADSAAAIVAAAEQIVKTGVRQWKRKPAGSGSA